MENFKKMQSQSCTVANFVELEKNTSTKLQLVTTVAQENINTKMRKVIQDAHFAQKAGNSELLQFHAHFVRLGGIKMIRRLLVLSVNFVKSEDI
jgi:hypothetical protein